MTALAFPPPARTDAQMPGFIPGETGSAMHRDIHEQPLAARAVAERYGRSDGFADFDRLDPARLKRIRIIGAGSSACAARIAERWFETVAGLPAKAEVACEFRDAPPSEADDEIGLLVSQSGETSDTVACMMRLREAGIPVVAVVNEPGGTLAREADVVLPASAGREAGVCATKSFTAALQVLARLALRTGELRGVDPRRIDRDRAALDRVPEWIALALENEPAVMEVLPHFDRARSALFVARGALLPVAAEGALKLKEIACIHAEALPAGELKHGPMALVDRDLPVVAPAASGPDFARLAVDLRRAAARGGRIVVVGDRAAILGLADCITTALTVPLCPAFVRPIVSTVPLQLLAHHLAVRRGIDVDRPRNLAKAVTDE